MKVTKEQIVRAQQIDLHQYLATSGYELKRHGNTYAVIIGEHDSTVYFKDSNRWYNFSSGEGGDIIDWVRRERNLSLPEAVEFLLNENGIAHGLKTVSHSVQEEVKKKPFVLPKAAESNKYAFAYLIKSRSINRYLVKALIDKKLIYVSSTIKKKENSDDFVEYKNVAFVNYDKSGNAHGAMLRSFADHTGKVFKGNAENTDRDFGFVYSPNESAETVTICESPIEALSYCSLFPQSMATSHFLSLNGVHDTSPKCMQRIIDNFLNDFPNVNKMVIALNNDELAERNHGKLAGDLIKTIYQDRFNIEEHYPEQEKDFNDILRKKAEESSRLKKRELEKEKEKELER